MNRSRIAFASEHTSIPKLDVSDALRELCRGLKSFAELKSAGASLISTLEQRAGAKLLSNIAPNNIRLPSGRQTKVNYETGKPPWIASRLQDFFGLRETPSIANGKVALVVHLLAPNHRPVQVTSDLAGGADNNGSRGILGAALSAGAEGVVASVSQA